MDNSNAKLTQKRVGMVIREAMREKRDVMAWCVEPKGFGCRARPSGGASYIFQFRTPGGRAGRTQKITIGKTTTFSPEEARVIARGYAQEVALGRDPRRPGEGAALEPEKPSSPTLRALFELFLEQNHARLSPKTLDGMRSHLRAQWADMAERPIDEIRRIDVAGRHAALTETPYAANRALATLSTLFSFAERMELRPIGSNPVRGVQKHKESHRERFMTADEIAALWTALVSLEAIPRHRFAAACIRLGLLTGWRVGEARTLEWRDVDLNGREAMIHGKTGTRCAPLAPPVCALLAPLSQATVHYGLGEHHGRYVFPSTAGVTDEFAPLTDWEHRRSWEKAVEVSGVENIRRHDLRHLVAGVIGMQTGSALRVKEAMGHRSVSVSERYVSPISDLQRRSTDQAAALIVDLATQKTKAVVV
ncbi:MAG: site-specific integrase [Rhodobacteraceae bacterium]|nr:site-specific integrase [Paracoccaceae bacterium]